MKYCVTCLCKEHCQQRKELLRTGADPKAICSGKAVDPDEEYRRILLDSYLKHRFPRKARDRYREKGEGNVVVSYMSDCILMLDCDLKRQDDIIEFAREYCKTHNLLDALVMRTSECMQVDLFGEPLGNFCVVFGRILQWSEIRWHVLEAFRLGMVDKGFVVIRKFQSITIRVSAKNNKVPYPKFVAYFDDGDSRIGLGIKKFLKYWAMCRGLGFKKTELEEIER